MFESDMDKVFNGCIPLNNTPPFIMKSSLDKTLSISQNLRSLCSSDLISLVYHDRYIYYFESLLHSLPINYFLESPNGSIGMGDSICQDRFIHLNKSDTPNPFHVSESPSGDIGNGDIAYLPTFYMFFIYYPNIPFVSKSPLSSRIDAGLKGDRLSTCFKYFIHLYAQHLTPCNNFFLNNILGGVNNTQNNTKSVTFYRPTKIFCGVNN